MAPLGAIFFLFYNQADPALNLKKKALHRFIAYGPSLLSNFCDTYWDKR